MDLLDRAHVFFFRHKNVGFKAVCYVAVSQRIGLRKKLVFLSGLLEKARLIAVQAVFFQKLTLKRKLRQDDLTGYDVADQDTAGGEFSGHKNKAVAVKGVFFSAHEGDAQAFFNAPHDPVDACLKCGHEAHEAEIDFAIRGEHRGPAVTGAEAVAHIQVLYVGKVQIGIYAFAVELRLAAAVGRAAHIDYAGDAIGC